MSKKLKRPPDPLLNYRYRVETDGIIEASFNEVSGLSMNIETENVKEGGVNDFVHKLPVRCEWGNIVLKRGITKSGKFWKWIWDCIEGNIKIKTVAIILMDKQKKDCWRWTVHEAYPVKWTGPELKAASGDIAMESLELVHNGITDKNKRK